MPTQQNPNKPNTSNNINTKATLPLTSDDNDNLNIPSREASSTEVYRPQKTEVLYTTLLDTSPIKTTQPSSSTHPNADETELFKSVDKNKEQVAQNTIVFDTIHLNPPAPSADLPPITATTDTPTTQETLTKTHKSEALTDSHILATSHQLIPTQDRLADDSNTIGSLIEHLGVATKQWVFTVNWERTDIPKAGLINQLKKKTESLDLDLTCLLCNRYGEVIERVWFKNMRDQVESVRHHGDELLGTKPLQPTNIEETTPDSPTLSTADRHANQERISVYFGKIPPHIFHLVFILSSYQSNALNKATNGICQLVDDEGNLITELTLSTLADDCSAVRVATLTRSADSWRFHTDFTQLTEHKMADIEQQISESLVRTAK